MNAKAMYSLTYGVYVLSARDNGRDNACIINTAVQVANNPTRISIAAIKGNLTHDMILATGEFNLSVLSEEATFWFFQHYGFQSGKDVDKFANIPEARMANGLRYLEACCNAAISGKVISTVDCGTHTLFIAEVTEAKVLSDAPSMTYQYYFDHVKPKPEPAEKASWVCKICGYVYEGDPLPEDFICPWCKHGPEDFEKR